MQQQASLRISKTPLLSNRQTLAINEPESLSKHGKNIELQVVKKYLNQQPLIVSRNDTTNIDSNKQCKTHRE